MSLTLIKLLFDQSHLNLLIIGAYRSNQVDEEHPLMTLLKELRQTEEATRLIRSTSPTATPPTINTTPTEVKSQTQTPTSPSQTPSRIQVIILQPLALADVTQLVMSVANEHVQRTLERETWR